MQKRARAWWLIVLAMPTVLLAALAGRLQLDAWRQAQSLRRWHEQIAAAQPARAQRLIAQLANEDGDGLEVVVAAWCDARPEVAAGATRAVQGLVERWSQLPPAAAGPRIAQLAELLAQHAPRMPAPQRAAARSLAQRLLIWPVESGDCDIARLLASCEALGQLPDDEMAEMRVAAAPEQAAEPPGSWPALESGSR